MYQLRIILHYHPLDYRETTQALLLLVPLDALLAQMEARYALSKREHLNLFVKLGREKFRQLFIKDSIYTYWWQTKLLNYNFIKEI